MQTNLYCSDLLITCLVITKITSKIFKYYLSINYGNVIPANETRLSYNDLNPLMSEEF